MPTPLSHEEIDRLARKRAGAKLGWYAHALVYVAGEPVHVRSPRATASGTGPGRCSRSLGWGLGLALHGISVFLLGRGSGLRGKAWCERERERCCGASTGPMRIDWIAKLRHCCRCWRSAWPSRRCSIAFMPGRPYAPAAGAIRCSSAPSPGRSSTSAATSCPRPAKPAGRTGWSGLVLVAAGIATGFLVGTTAGRRADPRVRPAAARRDGQPRRRTAHRDC